MFKTYFRIALRNLPWTGIAKTLVVINTGKEHE